MTNLNALADELHNNAVDHGFWDTAHDFPHHVMMIVTELVEAVDEDRAGHSAHYYRGPLGLYSEDEVAHTSDGAPYIVGSAPTDGGRTLVKPEGADVELIDTVIRCLDVLAARGADIDQLLHEKAAYNARREYLHGKHY